jgi:protein-tyrosine phosphatase
MSKEFVTQILSYLYVGCLESTHPKNLSELDIKLVISMNQSYIGTNKKIEYIQAYIEDLPTEPIYQHFSFLLELINESIIKKEKVLVHCIDGISSSVTIVIAYLMIYCHMKLDDADEFVKNKHKIANPNYGFYYQLSYLEDGMKGINTKERISMLKVIISSIKNITKQFSELES